MIANLILEKQDVEDSVTDILEDNTINPKYTKNGDGVSLQISDAMGHRIAELATGQLIGRNVNDAEDVAVSIWEDAGHMEGLTEDVDTTFAVAGNPHVELGIGDILSGSVSNLCVLLAGNSGVLHNGIVRKVKYKHHFMVEVDYELDIEDAGP